MQPCRKNSYSYPSEQIPVNIVKNAPKIWERPRYNFSLYQFQYDLHGTIALALTNLDDPGVSAITSNILWCNFVE